MPAAQLNMSPAATADALLNHMTAHTRAWRLGLVRQSDPAAQALIELPQVTNVAEYVADTATCRFQADTLGRKPHLLRQAGDDPGSFMMVPILGVRRDRTASGHFWMDISCGRILADEGVLLYWR